MKIRWKQLIDISYFVSVSSSKLSHKYVCQ